MISGEQLLAFGLAAFILIAIPGPSVVFVIGRALSYGRGVALASVVGNSLGLLVIVVLVALGLGIVVQESVVVFTVLKFAGAAYLVWLGVQAIRQRKSVRRQRGWRRQRVRPFDQYGDPPGIHRRILQPEGVHDLWRRAAAVR